MKRKRDARLYVWDIGESIEKIQEYTHFTSMSRMNRIEIMGISRTKS